MTISHPNTELARPDLNEDEEDIPNTTFSAYQLLSPADFCTHALETTAAAAMLDRDVVYTDVPLDWGRDVFDWEWTGVGMRYVSSMHLYVVGVYLGGAYICAE